MTDSQGGPQAQPRVLLAHERRGIARAVTRVLELSGFSVVWVPDGHQARAALSAGRFAALVVDVALPGVPGYELCGEARANGGGHAEDPATDSAPDCGADVVVLVASVYRRTSYKRKPSRLYGADDYVELHHLCDSLPTKLFEHLDIAPAPSVDTEQRRATAALRVEGDRRMAQTDEPTLAGLIVADMVLYNGDEIVGAETIEDAAEAIGNDLDIARSLYAQVQHAEGRGEAPGDPIGVAFAQLMRVMGRRSGASR